MSGGGEIYLDWNATTPLAPEVLEAMLRAGREAWANPASVHAAGRRARAVVEDARERVAAVLGVGAREVLFTGSATEANNLALARAPGLVTSRLEHASVTQVADALARRGVPVEWLPIGADGRVVLDELGDRIARLPRGTRVALMAANHETGVIQPLAEAAEIAHAHGAWLHVDAAQALGKAPVAGLTLADSLTLAPHKLRGPKASGILAWRKDWTPEPILVGGGQERGLRPGTVDPVIAAGVGAWAERVEASPRRYAELAPLRDALEARLAEAADVNGRGAPRLPHVSSLSFRGWRSDALVAALDLEGVRISGGPACAAGSSRPSAVISAMQGEERALGAIRVSLGELTTAAEIERAIAVFFRVLTR
ncbi:MAG: cysteine desulfurase [Polyangiaceae bacterium]|nr:cysteine desulfurase [Polyangiaceae bacterium]